MRKEKQAKIHDTALRQFDTISAAQKDEREQCLGDRRFYSIAGAQWEGPLSAQYENKPRMEFNKCHLSVIRIINEYRNNRITVDFSSKDGSDDKLADTCDGLYRADEQDSEANEAYDNAFEEIVGGGMGAWRLRAEYEDEYDDENDYQRIKIEPIHEADSCVYFDLDAKRQDKKDAKFCFVLTSLTREAYREEYGDDPSSWNRTVSQQEFDWYSPDVVYVAEYYVVEEKLRKLNTYKGLTDDEVKHYEDELSEEKEAELEATGYSLVASRKIKARVVHKYLLSGGKILEDCGLIAGREIPIIPVYGKRWFVDNIERAMGHVRLAKGAQRLKNMQITQLAENAAHSTVEKPIFSPEQIAGHQQMWADDNLKNYPFLMANPLEDAEGKIVATGPIAYTKPSTIPPSTAALIQTTEEDMRDILGNAQGGEVIESNMSGKAVELVQNRLDMQTFIYMSNFAKGMKRCGEVWLSMAKQLYIEGGRKMKALDKEGNSSSIELSEPMIKDDNSYGVGNDLSKASFDVIVDVGPSSSSKRAATVRAVTGMMQVTQDPQDMNVLSAMALMNLEGEGISDVREYARKKLVKLGVGEPTDKDLEEMQAAGEQSDPQAEYLQAEAAKAESEIANNEAKTYETMENAKLKQAQTAKTKAETFETMANVEREDVKAANDFLSASAQPNQ